MPVSMFMLCFTRIIFQTTTQHVMMASTLPEETSSDWVTINSDVTTESASTGSDSAGIAYVLSLPLALVILLTVSANVIVIVCVKSDKKLWKPTNLYVASLAVADAVVGLVVMSFMTVYTLYRLWPLGEDLCTLWACVDFAMCTISMLHLCLIAQDRYTALSQPIKYRSPTRWRFVMASITVAWILGLLVWIPPIVYYRKTGPPTPNDCYFIPPNRTYILVQSILVYYTPILIMLYFYVICLWGLRGRMRKIQDMAGAAGNQNAGGQVATVTGASGVASQQRSAWTTEEDSGSVAVSQMTTTVSTINTSDQTSTLASTTEPRNQLTKPRDNRQGLTQQQRRQAEHVRSLRTLGVIMATFLFCWLPFCLFWPIAAHCETCIPARVYEYSYWAAYLNSTVNPALYFVCNKEFRAAFGKLVRRLRKR